MRKRFLNLQNFEDDVSLLENALSLTDKKNHLLAFKIQGQLFGIEIQFIREMTALKLDKPPKAIPNTPNEILGAVNIRGEIIPVLDIRKKLNLPPKPYVKFDIIMVIETAHQIFGIIIDEADDMAALPDEKIEGTETEDSKKNPAILFYCTYKGKIIPILNPQNLFPQADLSRIKEWS